MALTRFGVAMESSLLAQFDDIVRERRSTRSEVLRDLARAEIVRSLAARPVEAFASVTVVYDHHVRELSERITQMQHELGDQVRSTMHVHLDHARCLEVIVMRGRADRLQKAAEALFATRGVLQGSIEVVADTSKPPAPHGGRAPRGDGDGHAHLHDHDHDHDHDHAPTPGPKRRRAGRPRSPKAK